MYLCQHDDLYNPHAQGLHRIGQRAILVWTSD